MVGSGSNRRTRAVFLFPLGAGALWGIIGLFVRRFYEAGLSGMEVVAVRSVVVALLLLPVVALRGRGRLRVRWKDGWIFAGLGIASIVFFNWCYFHTMEKASLGVAATLMYAAPSMVLLMSAGLFGERLTVRKGVACLLAFAGCAMVSGWLGGGVHLRIPFGVLLSGLGSAFGFALYSVFGRVATGRGYRSETITVWTFVVAAVGTLPFIRLGHLAEAFCGEPVLWGWAAALGAGVTLVPYLLYSAALRRMEAGRAALVASVEPVVAALTGVLLFEERLTWCVSLGIVLVVGSLVLLALPGRR